MGVRYGLTGAALLAAWCVAGAIPEARAQDTWRVGDDIDDHATTIQGGIDLATDGDTVLVDAGNYAGTGNRDINFNGKQITVQGVGGSAACIVDVQNSGSHRGFHFNSDEDADTAFLIGFTIRDGNVTGTADGGGIRIAGNCSVTIQDCIIESCHAGGRGGGVYIYNGGGARFYDCIIRNNDANTSGGGISMIDDTSILMENCEVSGNTAGGNGGGLSVRNSSSAIIVGSRIRDNATTANGSNGGGIYLEGNVTSVVLDHSFVNDNEGAAGGGIYADDGFLSLRNSVVNANTAFQSTGDGGGIALVGGVDAEVKYCTVFGNAATDHGGGIYVGSAQRFIIEYSIVWGNTQKTSYGSQGESIEVVTEPSTFGGYYCSMPDDPFDGSNGAFIFSFDPNFSANADGVYCVLSAYSSCVDAIPYTSVLPWSTDIDGQGRQVDGADGDAVEESDMGADEVQ